MALLHTHTNIREDSGDWVMNITLPHDERLFPYHHQNFAFIIFFHRITEWEGEDIETQKIDEVHQHINDETITAEGKYFCLLLKIDTKQTESSKSEQKNVTTRTERENKKQSRGLD